MTAMIWCPCPDRECAAAIANRLLDEKLIGCANLLDGVESIFDWQGQRESARECILIAKTDALQLDAAIAQIAALHPYETPAILGWNCDQSADATRAWLQSIGKGDKG